MCPVCLPYTVHVRRYGVAKVTNEDGGASICPYKDDKRWKDLNVQ